MRDCGLAELDGRQVEDDGRSDEKTSGVFYLLLDLGDPFDEWWFRCKRDSHIRATDETWRLSGMSDGCHDDSLLAKNFLSATSIRGADRIIGSNCVAPGCRSSPFKEQRYPAHRTWSSVRRKQLLNQARQIAGAWRAFLNRNRGSIESGLPQSGL